MKNLKLLAIAFVIGFSSLFAANNTVVDIPLNKKISSEIRKLLKAPDFYIEEDVELNVMLTFDDAGKIIVIDADTKNRELARYIMKSLNGKSIQTPGESKTIYTLPLKIQSY